MLLEHTNMRQLSAMLENHKDRSVWPGLHREDDRDRLRASAKARGMWDGFARAATREPIEVLPRSVYRQFRRDGSREGYQEIQFAWFTRIAQASGAVWLEHPDADLDYLQDLLWHTCDMHTWVMPAHEHSASGLELGSTRYALILAEALYLLEDKLEEEVADRLANELDRRMLEPAFDWRVADGWATTDMNWNHVCNANLIQIAMYRIAHSYQLAHFIHPLINRLHYAILGFASDGGCLEGPGYWGYGFGHYVDAATVVHHRTGGQMNLMDDDHIRRICRYPLKAHFTENRRATFADSGEGHIPARTAAMINRFEDLPGLLAIAAKDEEGRLGGSGAKPWPQQTVRELAVVGDENVTATFTPTDAVLPDMGVARMVAGDDNDRTVVAALAGRNDVPHNHNDVGSFIYFRQGRQILTDPGAPRYTAKTFGPDRYDLIYCRTRGHSLPIINGHEQPKGGEYRGSLSTDNLSLEGQPQVKADLPRTAVIDMADAYPVESLTTLRRTLSLHPDGRLTIADSYGFTSTPESVEEGFVTHEPVAIADDGRSAVLGEGDKAFTLRATDDTPGRFAVADLEDSLDGSPNRRMLRRITFTPETLAAEMVLAFEIARRGVAS